MDVTYLALADSHRIGKRDKVDALGLFTSIGLWATPAEREISVIIGLRNVVEGKVAFSIWLRRPRKKSRKVAEIRGQSRFGARYHVTAQRVTLAFDAMGSFEVGVRIGSRTRWFPFFVNQSSWPTLPTGAELKKALSDPNRIKGGRIEVQCKKCDRKVLFEVHLDPDHKLSKGARAFPADGKFKCRKCGTWHNIRDAHGQLLATLAGPPSGSHD